MAKPLKEIRGGYGSGFWGRGIRLQDNSSMYLRRYLFTPSAYYSSGHYFYSCTFE